ncbi:hypothetical protein NOJ28_11420 [Neorhizobium galegae]|uniref:hypothetical protein n=1 Tax=Neorhizobium galegae TaxID=399 RepID=UPI002103F0CF|nr:hypothetical protein [Neorhizobium galegae]MCQ1766145.1 hypothetical protein [Neorhizobium galegae]MCQ1845059.1 hypothetical protein [Neorhizobium galegae]
MSDDSRLPDDFTLEDCQRYLVRICIEIAGAKDPAGLFPWFDFLEKEIVIKKEGIMRMERIHQVLRDAGLDPDALSWKSRMRRKMPDQNAKKPPPKGR